MSPVAQPDSGTVILPSEQTPIEGARLSEFRLPLADDGMAGVIQLLDDVARCHARGIIHRDIKPSNIIVTETGALRLMDFDVAAYRGARSTWPGREDVRIGTLPYSAPEQILDPATATYETADIFSLGVVLYEVLTGRLPFPMTDDESEEEYRARLPFEAPVPPTAYRPGLAPELETVLLKAIRRDPADRHPSVAELRMELEAAFGVHGAGAPASRLPHIIHHPFTLLLIVAAGAWLFRSF